jgi:hypothetical protein
MNIDFEGYTRAQITTALFSSARKVRYEYSVENALGAVLGLLEIQNGSVTYDSKADVMRTFNGYVKKSDLMNIDCIDYRITPWLCLQMPDGKEAKWPLGKFLVVPYVEGNSNINMIRITGYDFGKIAYDEKTTSRFYVPAGAVYTAYIAQLLDEYDNLDIDASTATKAFAQEWDIGEVDLHLANTLLAAINYTPLHFDENGVGQASEYVTPTDRLLDFSYIANQTSIITDGISIESDKFNIPNKWVRYTENVDAAYLISTYVNDSEASPYSTVNRGRTIVDIQNVEDIADQNTLDAYTIKVANEAMQVTDTLTFSTLNMPGHGYQECLWVEIPEYGIADKYVEVGWDMNLTQGGLMTHRCEKAVSLV